MPWWRPGVIAVEEVQHAEERGEGFVWSQREERKRDASNQRQHLFVWLLQKKISWLRAVSDEKWRGRVHNETDNAFHLFQLISAQLKYQITPIPKLTAPQRAPLYVFPYLKQLQVLLLYASFTSVILHPHGQHLKYVREVASAPIVTICRAVFIICPSAFLITALASKDGSMRRSYALATGSASCLCTIANVKRVALGLRLSASIRFPRIILWYSIETDVKPINAQSRGA